MRRFTKVMKLSVIIPAYNVEKYISECLDSVLVTEKDIEVIIVDDGSKDNTLSICEDYSKKDSRVKVYSKPNGGVSSARNYGLEKVSGDYIIFVDSDDYLFEGWDALMDPLSGDDIYYYNKLIKGHPDKKMMLRYISGVNDENICIAGPVWKAYKSSFLLGNDLKFKLDLINGEDMLFNLEAILLAESYQIIDFDYYYYRQTVGQTTRRFDDRIIGSDTKFHHYLVSLFREYKADEKTAADIRTLSVINAVIVILDRISYIDRFSNAKEKYAFLEKKPYRSVLGKNNSLLFKLARAKRYRTLYYYMKSRNSLSMTKRKVKEIISKK